MDLRELESVYADEEVEHDTKGICKEDILLAAAKNDITGVCFLNIQWFGRLRDILEEQGLLDGFTEDFIEHCQQENKNIFDKYK